MPTSLPGGRPSGITAASPTSPRGRERGETRHVRGLERRAIVELGERLVGTTVGNEHEVLHVVQWYGEADATAALDSLPRPMPARAGRERSTDRDRARDHR